MTLSLSTKYRRRRVHSPIVLAIAVAAAAVLAMPPPADGGDEVLTVRTSPELSPEPGLVRLLIRLEPNEANRSLVVELDSPAMFRSSLITLDGDAAPSTHWLEFGSLPAGKYGVVVTLERAGDTAVTATDSFLVVR
jgi:hypothetical protein